MIQYDPQHKKMEEEKILLVKDFDYCDSEQIYDQFYEPSMSDLISPL